MSKEKAKKYIKAAQTAIDEAPYPCTTKAKENKRNTHF